MSNLPPMPGGHPENAPVDTQTPQDAGVKKGGILDRIEKLGNALPDPAALFLIGTLLVFIASGIASAVGWEVELKQPVSVIDEETGEQSIVLEPKLDANGDPETIVATNLLSSDGVWWLFSTMVDNFMDFPPLGVVLVGMLGIGVAERTGMVGALLKLFMLVTPKQLLTPAMVFLGVLSSAGVDAGYIVLPPLAGLLYLSVGRSPLVGIAAVFSGVSAGFCANIIPTGLDPLLAELTNQGTAVIDEDYKVNPLSNWWFMIASTVMATFVGWFTTAVFVEPRFDRKSPEDGGPPPPDEHATDDQGLTATEKKGIGAAALTLAIVLAIFAAAIFVPGGPLNGKVPLGADATAGIVQKTQASNELPKIDTSELATSLATTTEEGAVSKSELYAAVANATTELTEEQQQTIDDAVEKAQDQKFERGIDVIVPLLMLCFLLPSVAYGFATKVLTGSKAIAKLMCDAMGDMGPIIVLAFFAAQFIEAFEHAKLDKMLAITGGEMLAGADMPTFLIILAFILVTATFNLFVGSMSAKYAIFAPIFVPMLMVVGISPELTQAAYRIGDSVTNIITPLNSYLIIIVVFMQRFVPKSGVGTLVAMMLPYTIAFTIAWCVLLGAWMILGVPLGLDGGLTYTPSTSP